MDRPRPPSSGFDPLLKRYDPPPRTEQLTAATARVDAGAVARGRDTWEDNGQVNPGLQRGREDEGPARSVSPWSRPDNELWLPCQQYLSTPQVPSAPTKESIWKLDGISNCLIKPPPSPHTHQSS